MGDCQDIPGCQFLVSYLQSISQNGGTFDGGEWGESYWETLPEAEFLAMYGNISDAECMAIIPPYDQYTPCSDDNCPQNMGLHYTGNVAWVYLYWVVQCAWEGEHTWELSLTIQANCECANEIGEITIGGGSYIPFEGCVGLCAPPAGCHCCCLGCC